MSSLNPARIIATTELTATAVALYTVAVSTQCVIRTIALANHSVASQTTTVYFVPSGGTADDTTTVIKEIAVPAKTTIVLDGLKGLLLIAGESIYMEASNANDITVTASGTEIT